MNHKNSNIIKKANDILKNKKTTPDKAATEAVYRDIINKKMQERILGMELKNDKKSKKKICDMVINIMTKEISPLLSKTSASAVVDSKNNIVDIEIYWS